MSKIYVDIWKTLNIFKLYLIFSKKKSLWYHNSIHCLENGIQYQGRFFSFHFYFRNLSRTILSQKGFCFDEFMNFLKPVSLENSSSALFLTLSLMTKFSCLHKASCCDPLRGAQAALPGSHASVRCWSVEWWPFLLLPQFVLCG